MQESNGASQAKKTIVEQDTSMKGALESNCPIVVLGKIEGEVKAPALSVSATGVVHGVVKADEIESEGELSGEFEAESVRLSGVVKDKSVVRARFLEMKAASAGGMEVSLGECTLEVGDMPDKEAAIRAALDHGSPATPPRESTPPKAQHGRKRNSTIPPQAP
jgi:hypothetical protein